MLRRKTIAWFVIGFWLILLAYPRGEWLALDMDSSQYEEIADQMISGRYFELSPTTRPTLGVAMRAPLYPLALVAARVFGGSDLQIGIVRVHLLCAAICMALCVYLMQRWFDPRLEL